jgi:hypothetical protein
MAAYGQQYISMLLGSGVSTFQVKLMLSLSSFDLQQTQCFTGLLMVALLTLF